MAHRNESVFTVIDTLATSDSSVDYYSLEKLETQGFPGLSRLPVSIRILVESVVRNANGREVTDNHVRSFGEYNPKDPGELEIPFSPARVLLQDFTGVPCVVDLA
ncbi:MAG: aconitate hydratase, partial [Spirochaetaceae bacterium]|nr:aconitate hydratase [Spirochaetaceae bacterium]